MLKTLVMLASIANCAGGLVLIFTWATMWQRVPIIVLFIGVSLLIQGGYTILYLRGDLDGFGALDHGSLVLCLFSHFRGDMRAYIIPSQGKRLELTTWRRALILTSTGERYMTDLFREGNVPDRIWLHNSGKIVIAEHKWEGGGAGPKIQLRRIDLQLGAE
jgi:hypothetical protein